MIASLRFANQQLREEIWKCQVHSTSRGQDLPWPASDSADPGPRCSLGKEECHLLVVDGGNEGKLAMSLDDRPMGS